jgi:hypothetical protein
VGDPVGGDGDDAVLQHEDGADLVGRLLDVDEEDGVLLRSVPDGRQGEQGGVDDDDDIRVVTGCGFGWAARRSG